ncbi:MAG: hypothetical protein RBS40_08570 [Rhodocyclaceae bacterium]|jgi:hypothetical protein|nr:hypothetical protein [Rhodocyclaceae bacterium]
MATLQAFHGRIIELRRHTNVHRYGYRPLGPADRYELWIKPPAGGERKFTVNTRTMPARRGHAVSLIVTAGKVPRVLGLANWTTADGVNYARTEAPPLLRVHDFPALAVIFLMMAIIWGDPGMVLFVLVAVAYGLIASAGRAVIRSRRGRELDLAIDAEAARLGRRRVVMS